MGISATFRLKKIYRVVKGEFVKVKGKNHYISRFLNLFPFPFFPLTEQYYNAPYGFNFASYLRVTRILSESLLPTTSVPHVRVGWVKLL